MKKTTILKSLQTLRLIASLGVVQYHLWQNYFGIPIGHPGTDFFLILVGVVAAYTQAKRIPEGGWWRYISSRYKRLYVTFIPLFLITLLAKWHEADLNWIVRSFFFIPLENQLPVIGATWMLSMFMLFYLVFSLAFIAKTEKILWGLFLLWASLILLNHFTGWNAGLAQHWTDLFFGERNLDFIMGYIAGVVLRQGWLSSSQSKMLLWLGIIGTIAGCVMLNLGSVIARSLIVGFPVALFILGVADSERKNLDVPLVTFLTTPFLVWIGETSYVLYLSHSLVFRAWSLLLPVTVSTAFPMTIGAIIVGALGYVFWEQPILSYLKTGKWTISYPPFTQNKV